jgi:hypothetical protein
MTMPTVELRCDACAEPAFLFRLHGTVDALCAPCFLVVHPPESTLERRVRRSRTAGPAAAGCLRRLRLPSPATGVHRVAGRVRR